MAKRKSKRTYYEVEQQLQSEINWIKQTFKYKQPELIAERLSIWRNSGDALRQEVARHYHV